MHVFLPAIALLASLLLNGCSSDSSELTFKPLYQDKKITVPGVTATCEYKDQALARIKEFYTYGKLSPLKSWMILENPECFNDPVLTDWVSQNSPQGQDYLINESKSWMPKGFENAYEGNKIVEGFAIKVSNSNFKCEIGTESCFSILVVSRDGCKNGIFINMKYTDLKGNPTDTSGNELGGGTAITETANPLEIKSVVFNSFNANVKNGIIEKIACH
jgi:hypothetical protein